MGTKPIGNDTPCQQKTSLGDQQSHLTRFRTVAFHGFSGAGTDFDLILQHLPDISLYAPDYCRELHLFFQAEKAPPTPATITARLSNELVQPESTAQRDPVVIMGYSMGSRLALSLALARPELCAALVLVSCNPGLENPSEEEQRRASDEELAAWITAHGAEKFIERWWKIPLIATQRRAPAAHLQTMKEARQKLDLATLAWSLRTFGQGIWPNMWGQLSRLTMPVLVVAGDEDQKYGKIAARIASQAPNTTLATINHSGHAPHIENAALFCDAVAEFLSGLTVDARSD